MNTPHKYSVLQFTALSHPENNNLILDFDPLGQKLIEDDSSRDHSCDDHQVDRIDISRGRITKKKFLNQVFAIQQQRKLFNRVDFGPILAQKEFSKRFVIYSILWFFSVIITGYLIFQAIQDEPLLAQVNSIVMSAMTEYKTDPMLEIQASDSSNSCPPGFDSVLLGEWPGTYAACFCPSENILRQGECRSHVNLPDDCSDVSGTSSSPLYAWDKISSFCVKRAQLESDYVKSETCPKDYKTCSFGVCMTNSTPCPITSLLVTDSIVNPESIQIDNSKYLTPQRDLDKPPLFSLGITQDFSPSLLLKENSSKSEGQESLDQELNTILGSSDASQLLTENQVTGDIYQISIYQSSLKEQKVDFVTRRRLEIIKKEECFGIEDEPYLNSNTLYGGIIDFHCGLMIYYTIIVPLAYLNYKRPQVQQFLQNCCVQVLLRLSWLGLLIFWGVFCSHIGRSKYLVLNCFKTPVLNQILDDVNNTFYLKKSLLLLNCALTIYPLTYFKIIKDSR